MRMVPSHPGCLHRNSKTSELKNNDATVYYTYSSDEAIVDVSNGVVVSSSKSLDYRYDKEILAHEYKRLKQHDMIYGQTLSELDDDFNVLRDEKEETTDFDGRFGSVAVTRPAVLDSVDRLKGPAGIKPPLVNKHKLSMPLAPTKPSICTTERQITGETTAYDDSEEVTTNRSIASSEKNDDDNSGDDIRSDKAYDDSEEVTTNRSIASSEKNHDDNSGDDIRSDKASKDSEDATSTPKSASGDENNDDDNMDKIPSDKDYREDETKVELDERQDLSTDDEYDITVSTKHYDGPTQIYLPDHYLDDA